MKIIAAAAVAALIAGAPAFAQPAAPPAAAPSSAAAAPAAGGAHGRFTVDKSTIKQIIADPKAKAVLEAQLPEIPQYYDQIGDMTLAQIQPMSQGAISDDKMKAIQAAFDAL